MTLFVTVPVKPLSEGKSRLAGCLDPQERRALNALLLARTLDLVGGFCSPSRAIIVSRDAQVLDEARRRNMVGLQEPDGADLNGALAAATLLAAGREASALLILPVDLPLATAESLHALCPDDPQVITLAPDRLGSGTNALFQRPILLDTYQFGPGSLARHRSAAERAGCPPRLVHSAALALDIDRPSDLALWRRLPDAEALKRPAENGG